MQPIRGGFMFGRRARNPWRTQEGAVLVSAAERATHGANTSTRLHVRPPSAQVIAEPIARGFPRGAERATRGATSSRRFHVQRRSAQSTAQQIAYGVCSPVDYGPTMAQPVAYSFGRRARNPWRDANGCIFDRPTRIPRRPTIAGGLCSATERATHCGNRRNRV